MSSFYIYLPSNTKGTATNKTSNFTVQLPKRFEFHAPWAVGLTNIIYPHSWSNIGTNQEEYIEIKWLDGGVSHIKIPSKMHESISDLVETLNNALTNNNTFHICYTTRSKREVDGSRVDQGTRAFLNSVDLEIEKFKQLLASAVTDDDKKKYTKEIADFEAMKKNTTKEALEERSRFYTPPPIAMALNSKSVHDNRQRISEIDRLIREKTDLRDRAKILRDRHVFDLSIRDLRQEKENLEKEFPINPPARDLLSNKPKPEPEPKPAPELPKPELPKHEHELPVPTPAVSKPETPKPKPATPKPKPELPKPEVPKPKLETPKPEVPKPELPKPEVPKPAKPEFSAHDPKPVKPNLPNPVIPNSRIIEIDRLLKDSESKRENAVLPRDQKVFDIKIDELKEEKESLEKLIDERQNTVMHKIDEKLDGKEMETNIRLNEIDNSLNEKEKLKTKAIFLRDKVVYDIGIKNLKAEKETLERKIPSTPNDLRCVDTEAELSDLLSFVYDAYRERFVVNIDKSKIAHVSFSKQLGYILGFDSNLLEDSIHIAPYTADIKGGIHTLYIYAPSLIENTIIGNNTAPLLRILKVKGIPGETLEESFVSPQYHGLLQKQFTHINIEIRTNSGRLVPFNFGDCILTLHFKKLAFV